MLAMLGMLGMLGIAAAAVVAAAAAVPDSADQIGEDGALHGGVGGDLVRVRVLVGVDATALGRVAALDLGKVLLIERGASDGQCKQASTSINPMHAWYRTAIGVQDMQPCMGTGCSAVPARPLGAVKYP